MQLSVLWKTALWRRTVDEELEQWKAEREAEVEHLNAEIFKAESYLRCLRQLKDAAILCSFPRMTMKVEKKNE